MRIETMRFFLAAAMLTLAGSAWAQNSAGDAPFGFKAGSDPLSYESCVKFPEQPGSFVCLRAPQPHPDAYAYVLSASKETGVCNILANFRVGTRDEVVDSQAVIAKTEELLGQMQTLYGKYEKGPSALGKSPRYRWGRDVGSTLPDSINRAFVTGPVAGDNGPYAMVSFALLDGSTCVEAIRREATSGVPAGKPQKPAN